MMLRISRTRSGLPALWEGGGGYSNTGSARVVAREDGGRPRAIYIRRRGHLACDDHALVVLRKGMYILDADHHREDYETTLYRVISIPGQGDRAEVKIVATYRQGEWLPEWPPPELDEAIKAVVAKANCYHCREPHWVEEPPQR